MVNHLTIMAKCHTLLHPIKYWLADVVYSLFSDKPGSISKKKRISNVFRVAQWKLEKQILVGGGYLPPWKMMEWKSVGVIFPNIWKNKKCSKPPTRIRVKTCQVVPPSLLADLTPWTPKRNASPASAQKTTPAPKKTTQTWCHVINTLRFVCWDLFGFASTKQSACLEALGM